MPSIGTRVAHYRSVDTFPLAGWCGRDPRSDPLVGTKMNVKLGFNVTGGTCQPAAFATLVGSVPSDGTILTERVWTTPEIFTLTWKKIMQIGCCTKGTPLNGVLTFYKPGQSRFGRGE